MSLKPDRDHGRDARPPAPKLPAVCRLLRTKTAYRVGERGALWKLGDSETASYWCLATMEAFGPDDSFCHPHQCGRGRACFEPRPEDEED
jgi:hypothetical protein